MIIYSTIYILIAHHAKYWVNLKAIGTGWVQGGHVYERAYMMVVSFNATQCCDEEMNENIYVRNVLL